MSLLYNATDMGGHFTEHTAMVPRDCLPYTQVCQADMLLRGAAGALAEWRL